MKLVIASDLHGSATWTRALIERVEVESPDHVVLLGDLLYHGPRNDLPQGHAPREEVVMLNAIASLIIAVRGNCDAEVDQMMLDFPCMSDYALVVDGARTLFLTHGHVPGMTPDDARAAARVAATVGTVEASALPVSLLSTADAYLFGHTHVKTLERPKPYQSAFGEVEVAVQPGGTAQRGLLLVNPGSVSLPKDGSHSYATYDNGLFTLKTLDGEPLSAMEL